MKIQVKKIKDKIFKKITKIVNGKEVSNEYEMSKKYPNQTTCGLEIPDPKPLAIPANIKKRLEQSKSPKAMLQEMLAAEKANLQAEGYETEEEFNDFDMPEGEYKTSYEFDFDLHEALLNQQGAKFMPEEPVSESSLKSSNPPEGADKGEAEAQAEGAGEKA